MFIFIQGVQKQHIFACSNIATVWHGFEWRTSIYWTLKEILMLPNYKVRRIYLRFLWPDLFLFGGRIEVYVNHCVTFAVEYLGNR